MKTAIASHIQFRFIVPLFSAASSAAVDYFLSISPKNCPVLLHSQIHIDVM